MASVRHLIRPHGMPRCARFSAHCRCAQLSAARTELGSRHGARRAAFATIRMLTTEALVAEKPKEEKASARGGQATATTSDRESTESRKRRISKEIRLFC